MVSDDAATALAAAGDASAAPHILASLRFGCGFESISLPLVAALAALASPDMGVEIVALLDGLWDEEIEDEPSDVGDEYWRLREAFTAVIAGMGERARPAVLRGLASPNPETRICVQEAKAHLEEAGIVFDVTGPDA